MITDFDKPLDLAWILHLFVYHAVSAFKAFTFFASFKYHFSKSRINLETFSALN